jgi:hypothetical protein
MDANGNEAREGRLFESQSPSQFALIRVHSRLTRSSAGAGLETEQSIRPCAAGVGEDITWGEGDGFGPGDGVGESRGGGDAASGIEIANIKRLREDAGVIVHDLAEAGRRRVVNSRVEGVVSPASAVQVPGGFHAQAGTGV